MTGHCPCCGQVLPLALAVDINRNVASRGGREVKLRPSGAVILHVLCRKAGKQVSHAELGRALWGGSEGPADEINNIAVHIAHLRVAVAPLGVVVENIARRGYLLNIKQMAEACP